VALNVTLLFEDLSNSHTWGTRPIARINCDVFTCELETARGLYFQLFCWIWRTFQGRMQSRTLQKWLYLRNGAR